MKFPNIEYFLFRHNDSNEAKQVILYTKKGEFSYFLILESDKAARKELGREEFQLFAKFKLNDKSQTSGFMRYHLDDWKSGWQGKIEDDKVEAGVITFFEHNAIEELTTTDKEAFFELHKTLFQLASWWPELPDGLYEIDEIIKDEDESMFTFKDQLMLLMGDKLCLNTEKWPWSEGKRWIPDELSLYYMQHWKGRVMQI